MKSKTKTLPTDAVLRDMLKQAGLDSAQRRQTRRW